MRNHHEHKPSSCPKYILDALPQELARLALRQRQMREQECAHINSIKIHNQWRKIMRLAKVEELRQQIEILSQNHEREVDRKDALIQASVQVHYAKL
jgi:hypothetical protein